MTLARKKILFLFPGQGSQYPGIGSDLLGEFQVVRDTYDSASEALGYDMADLSGGSAGGKIDLTRYTQPALLTHSIACLRALAERCGDELSPAFACGHSLGEYSALVAAGSLEFESAVKLVSRRGELMGEHGEGEMLAVPLSEAVLSPLAHRNHCAIAACNLPEQTVAGGAAKDLSSLIEDLEAISPGKSGVRLKTEGAFHTFYMVSAARAFREVLADVPFAPPKCPVSSNFTGGFHDADAASIRAMLYFQLFNPVLWHRNLLAIADEGVDAVIEFGGGLGEGTDPASKRPNLASMVMRAYRRVSPRPKYFSVINSGTLEETLRKLGEDG